MKVKVNITDGGLREALDRVRGNLQSAAELHQAMAHGVEESVRGHLLGLNTRSRHTGYYAKASRSVESKWSATEGLVIIPHRGVALRYYGGRVTMKDRLLALPTDDVPVRGDERMRPGEMKDLAFVPNRKGGPSVTVGYLVEGEVKGKRTVPKRGGKLMYVLRGWTDHSPDPTVLPDQDALTAAAAEAAEDYLAASLEEGGLA